MSLCVILVNKQKVINYPTLDLLAPLELVFSDVWGPCTSVGGATHLLCKLR
jgi:hypothetical protein